MISVRAGFNILKLFLIKYLRFLLTTDGFLDPLNSKKKPVELDKKVIFGFSSQEYTRKGVKITILTLRIF